MYLLLDTSTATCRLTLVGQQTYNYEWHAERQLAKGLLAFLVEKTNKHGVTLSEISGFGVFRGPGSFTGLRIGSATLNTIAAFEAIAIVGATGESWQDEVLEKLRAGVDEKIILPEYGRSARITQPRK